MTRRPAILHLPLLFLLLALAASVAPALWVSTARGGEAESDSTQVSPLQKLLRQAQERRESGEDAATAAESADKILPAGFTRLTSTEGRESVPRWAPDGKAVYYVYREGMKGEIRKLDIASGEYRVLSAPGTIIEQIDVDPMGEFIAYSGRTELGRNLWVMRISDGAIAKLTGMEVEASESNPCYNHTGKKLYYTCNKYGSSKHVPMVIQRDGENPQELLDVEGTHRYPAISNDGEKLAWIFTQGAEIELRIFNTQITALYEDFTVDGYVLGSVAWAPGDQRLLLSLVNRDNPLIGYDIFLFSLEGGEMSPLINLGKNDLDGRFSPDGNRIVFRSDWAGQDDLYLFELP